MPLTKKGAKLKRKFRKQYGKKRGDQVFYASKNSGRIKGVERKTRKKKTRKKR